VPLLEVNAAWRNPRYSAKKIVNDIGILKLTTPVTNIAPIALPTTAMNAKITKLKNYTLYGWGVDQNGVEATFLRTAKIPNQDAAAKKSMSKLGYSSTTMLAAGQYIKSERIYAGACNGDSGGPLTTVVDGVEVIIGVTSWGMRECDLGKPSIFSRVTYFLKDIKFGNVDEVRNWVSDFFDSKPIEFYARGIQNLRDRCRGVIELNGEYYID
jgi:secreted trypsin-like serine protease